MIATIFHKGREYKVDFFKPIDISIAISAREKSVRAWYTPPAKIEPVVMGDWVGEVNRGGSVNFRNILFNPHGNGTHTECVGHISKEDHSVNNSLQRFHYIAELVSILPEQLANGDFVITSEQISNLVDFKSGAEALIIRTLGNGLVKLVTDYSNTNPPYVQKDAIELLNEKGIEHLLIDMPSVDREVDEGKLEAHHAFWRYPEAPRTDKTITELIYVPNEVSDGTYLLNLLPAPFENDASPSRPVIYRIF